MNKITHTYKYNLTLHLCLLFFAIIPVTKLVSLPCLLSQFTGRSLWISGLISTTIDTLFALLMALLRQKIDEPISRLLEKTIGKTLTKILFCIYAFLFIARSVTFVSGEKYFLETSYYEDTAFSYIFTPFFFLIFYLGIKGLKPYVRLSLFLAILSVVGIGLILVLTAGETRFEYLLPLKPDSFKGVIKGSLFNFTYGGEGIFLLFFTSEKHGDKKPAFYLILSFLSGYMLVVAVFLIFFSTFGPVAQTKLFAVSQMGHYSDVVAGVGRIDTFAVFMIDFVRMFALTLPLTASVELLRYVVGGQKKAVYIISASIALSFFLFANFFGTQTIFWFNFFFKRFMPAQFVMVYLLPLLLFFVVRKKNKTKLKEVTV